MVKLSDRLQKIADFIEPGESVADIGTDHGFLPAALWASGKSPYVILSDINTGPIEKARANLDKYFPEKEFDIRIGNGLHPLKTAEVDTVVIAGMGGLLIADILGDDPEKTKTFKKFILQPRTAQNKLRAWLLENGFEIKEEALVREGEYICEIIAAEPGGRTVKKDPEDIDLEISPILFAKNDPLLVEFIENKIRIEMKIYRAIKAEAVKNKNARLRKSKERIESLLDLIDDVDDRSG
jgi:tRNA (adenine22-N1)-methyltransferase